jgi:hypothetical protein
MEVTVMVSQIIKIFILLTIISFLAGCAQVKQVVSDVKEAIVGEKKDPPKAPAESKETKAPPPPAPSKKETKTSPPPASSKKETQKTTPPPVGEVFGPK